MSEDKIVVGKINFGPEGPPEMEPGHMIPIPAAIDTMNKCYAALSAINPENPAAVAEHIGEALSLLDQFVTECYAQDIKLGGVVGPAEEVLAKIKGNPHDQ